MLPNNVTQPQPVFRIGEVSPETLNYVQSLDFSSFVDSDKSDCHEQTPETPIKLQPHLGQVKQIKQNTHGGQPNQPNLNKNGLYNNTSASIMNIGASSVEVIEVESASDDPFESDDLEELLKAYPSSNSPQKINQNSSPVKQYTHNINNSSRHTESIQPSSHTKTQSPSAFMQAHTTHKGVYHHEYGTNVKSEINHAPECPQQEVVLSPDVSTSSTDTYFSCKSETEAEKVSSAKSSLLNRNAAKTFVKTLKPQSSNLGASPNSSLSSVKPSVRFSSPEKPLEGHYKKARFSSPIKYQSYESQLQYRNFSTDASKPGGLFNENPQSRPQTHNPTIQLATQRPGVSDGADFFIDENRSPETVKVAKPFCLSQEQKRILDLAVSGKSIFFTGSAGTGKSILLKSIIKELKAIKPLGSVAVTASTGLAACNIGGTTLHSFAGIGLGKGDIKSLIKTVRRNRKSTNKWKDTEVLIIDEISMIDGKLFDNLDQIARSIRRKYQSYFGGIQLIVCGDYYQLPPVSPKEIQTDGSNKHTKAVFAFESKAWEALDHSIVLKEVFRQKGDQEFIDMLNDMRHGKVSAEAADEFRRLSRPLHCPEGIRPTELYATRKEVESANTMRLNRINGEPKVFNARDNGSLPINVRNQWLSNFLAPRQLVLKEQAQVMCLKNIDTTLVNGSLGTVIKFIDRNTYLCENVQERSPELSFEEFREALKEEYESYRKKTDHVFNFLAEEKEKSDLAGKTTTRNGNNLGENNAKNDNGDEQGMKSDVIDEVKNEVKEETTSDVKPKVKQKPMQASEVVEKELLMGSQDDPFEAGSSFVAIDQQEIKQQNTDRKLQFIKDLQATSQGERYPLIRFMCPDGVTTRDHLMEPEKWEITDDKTEEVLVSRIQLPLMLAWALSIHKSQGQTLPRVKVDLSNIFENGQAYVALSRATSRQGLQVLNFREHRVRAHPIVDAFYRTLLTSDDLANEVYHDEDNEMDQQGAEI